MSPLCFAYYCSGHGFGHATRVSAFARHLLSLEESHTVYIISSAPKRVFATSIALGAIYRNAEIDPVILQPLAYHVDRQKSIHVLESFLMKKEKKIEEEAQWLRDIKVDCVLSDAAFLAFLAAHKSRIPSVLITNFTFDSIYSLLSASFVEQSHSQHLLANPGNSSNSVQHSPELDVPIPEKILSPLVQQIFEGYCHADMLLILPGAIPIPSFTTSPSLPATRWIDPILRSFKPEVITHLIQHPSTYTLYPSIPFPPGQPGAPSVAKPKPRSAHPAPLLVRPPNDGVYTPKGRSRFLSSIGIPRDLHDPAITKILIVSFGGQVFHKPSRSHTPSRSGSPNRPRLEYEHKPRSNSFNHALSHELDLLSRGNGSKTPGQVFGPSHIFVPGAPAPAAMSSPLVPTVTTIPPTPTFCDDNFSHDNTSAEQQNADPRSLMLPDASWIAVVCGVADSQEWQTKRRDAGSASASSGEEDNDLPEGFYIAPRDVYMPDLMAIGDVLLGKLGYGTVSECVDSCTPFVYVSRPLFVEEHGLRLLLEREGVGVEMTRDSYEAGEWTSAISDAWRAGAQRKLERRAGKHAPDRRAQGLQMARDVVTWVNEWAADIKFD
ncbi:hypothetical protein B0F90DRAFT_1809352 [Multifurca ochricompacta]|uniref:Glycosyltransferase n=1 Tax=Multifurca ochricompacta TaxID=376703 RepID=A0AAD4QNG9_9AGAM|nr:hypothetical protein B0F90DRAFT_1809352 [Multifurca ochricompacta]